MKLGFSPAVILVNFFPLVAYRGQCCSVNVMEVPLYFRSIKEAHKDLTMHLSQSEALKEK